MNAAKKIILLLWLVIVASLGNVSASTPGASENRVWEKSFSLLETCQAKPTQTAGRHQENEGAGYDYAPDSLLAAKSAGQLGREGEALASQITGAAKNTESWVVNGRTRIPDQVLAQDIVTRNPTIITEVKNVQYQSLSQQLRDYRDLVGPGGRVNVALPPGARVSGPLQQAFDNPLNPLNRIDLVPPR